MSPSAHAPIAAIATAPGRGGVGIVRVSGRELGGFVRALFQRDLTPRHAHLLAFRDVTGEMLNEVLDEGLALFFPAPHSYTGEDVLELQGHGGPAVLRRVLDLCLRVGADLGMRLAEPGEFTQRAFLNDRMDLAQAEAVADLIEATSEAAARGAMASLSGVFSERVTALADRIVHLRMLVEATLDFPEEEIDFLEKYQARPLLQGLRDDLDAIIAQTRQGVILREGLHVVLAGRPNVGKSSLLNALAGDDVAIVTPIAGTTRDKVVQEIHIDGVPLHVVDTAGLRETDDPVEKIGISRTWQEIGKADVILHLVDAGAPDETLDAGIAEKLPRGVPVVKVINKIDLEMAGDPTTGVVPGETALRISAKTGVGLDILRKALLDIAGWTPGGESPWLARERHLRALRDASDHLQLAAQHAELDDRVLDLFAEELRLAHDSLGSITGRFTSDDLLGEIFSSFCIGK
ncbi:MULTISPECIES: tRNA uridine-5-carboxymethylaminomethyl(34) synthesis GTPase MnmE [unclassified Achromobacter]|uniref:tRNA uridine-5-carboxymethylaminomethyl(34) synthesis GTPase MnmE n=1 Tax=unclassified Achromobacter TaxID=2626865 RepID=UPI000B517A9E|nr:MULTISPECIES: tRNA uridine-5-carboxymethylaminomethyl(34) synthesis GTPase MnmE [unclassified Achromobacter]OWT74311.1 tRNA uridine-5-carboxymethylaminomethyl(34) synthesis GTPase MnmE [Achromobacter sp. HZ34]OWT78778.1 tRNA uridine-5-carboxymethylaminomethyl(34) synthesis GTPase MnmE [Achromobacter sp. HZ28]